MENRTLQFRYSGTLLLMLMLSFASCKKDNLPADTPGLPVPDLALVPATETPLSPGNGTFVILNRYSGKPLEVSGASTANGANIIQWGANGGTNQRWTLNQLSGGYYSVIGLQSARAL